jgi:hypothetical protein
MRNEFVTYEQAVALKELGFDKECLAYWNYHTQELNYNSHPSTFHSEDVIQLPLKQQVLRWFRERYGLLQLIEVWEVEDDSTYEEAEDRAINKLIELNKEKDNGK